VATHATQSVLDADVVLPAHTVWEQEGTLVSMTGRAQRLRQGGLGPDGAAAAWEILIALAHRLGSPPVYRTPAGILKNASVTYPALAGIDYDAMGVLGAVIPLPEAPSDAPEGRREPAGAGVDLVVTAAVHGGPVAARSLALEATRIQDAVRLAPATAAALGVADGATAHVASPHGAATLPVRVDEGLPEDRAFLVLGATGAPAETLLPADRGAVRVTITPEDRA
jgi:NADH-quinone oxidoreductase subunit G